MSSVETSANQGSSSFRLDVPLRGSQWRRLRKDERGRPIHMLKRTVHLSVMLLLAGFSASPQFETRPVTGVVTDQRGNALRGAAVQLENTVSLLVVSYITDQDGRYHFSGLHDNVDYTLKAKYRSWWSKPKRLSKFDSSKQPEVHLVVPIE